MYCYSIDSLNKLLPIVFNYNFYLSKRNSKGKLPFTSALGIGSCNIKVFVFFVVEQEHV